MKLIELLVQELPKRGGWPEGAITADAFPYEKGLVNFFDENGEPTISLVKFDSDYKPEKIETVTREQYEAALASTQHCVHEWIPSEGRTESGVLCRNCGDDEGPRKYEKMKEPGQPVWDGEGLPPVGSECERSWCGDSWLRCIVLFVSDEMIVVKLPTHENAYRKSDVKFRPIRSEADKKREIGVTALALAMGPGPFEYGQRMSDGRLVAYGVYELYDKIAAGEVAGIKLSD